MKKAYEPIEFEAKIYSEWKKQGYFKAQDQSSKPAFCILMPPPNITGVLHNGHALFVTLQDILTRWKRMSGFNALWLPGTDHAGIATQMVVERDLAKQGKTKHDLGRQAFLEKVWEWKEKHGSIIVEQMEKLGASPDWDRMCFTLEPRLSQTVREVFVRLYNEGLIYRGDRIINWCFRCQTALSDLEVVSHERTGELYHIRYWTIDSKQSVVIATTRPETLLADTAVAVHPEDDRYKTLIGKSLQLPVVKRSIPIIADNYVEKEFGTGALKVTPGHDFNDYELGVKHKLAVINLLDKNGKINLPNTAYHGLKPLEARKKILEELAASNLLVKTENLTQQVGHCQRCESLLEPVISKQWFVNVKPLAKEAIEVVRRGEKLTLEEVDERDDAIKIVPESWTSTYYQWMENIRDWCISRQLWWGHQIPAWHCDDCEKITVSKSDPDACSACGSKKIKQDPDVLDTWFSSGLWPFSTLGWPEKTPAYKTFYPSSIMETGFDILFFWVARMIMMGLHFNEKQVPFKRVYLHAMVRDEKGQKMSKTKGNVIDPLDIVSEYGADAFRFTLSVLAGQGRDIKLNLDRVAGYKAFCNKLWNASRYVLMRLGYVESDAQKIDIQTITQGKSAQQWLEEHASDLNPVHGWILTKLKETSEAVNKGLEEFRVNDAANRLYHFVWDEYCDWYIEFSKDLLEKDKEATAVCLVYVLENILKLSHVFIPFISEEIYQNIPTKKQAKSLMLEEFPVPKMFEKIKVSSSSVLEVETVKAWVEKIRAFRGENNVSPKLKLKTYYELLESTQKALFEKNKNLLCVLAGIESLEVHDQAKTKDCFEVLAGSLKLWFDLKGVIDTSAESQRLQKELATAREDIEFVSKKLSNPQFTAKAPPALVAKEKEKLELHKKRYHDIEQALKKLS